MKKYFVLKSYRKASGSIEFQSNNLDDCKVWAEIMNRNEDPNSGYSYSVGTIIE